MPWDSLRPLVPGDDAARDKVIERLRTFTSELLGWNQGVSNLVSRDDEPRLVERHIAESLAGVSIINGLGCKQLLDFGSGGGFPAIPLALAGVGERWTLVESRRNKTLFLKRAVQALGLEHVRVVTGRLETLDEEAAERLQVDALTSRATLKLGATLALAARFVRAGGHAILWKGSGVQDELAAVEPAIRAQWSEPELHVIGDGPSSVVVFKRS